MKKTAIIAALIALSAIATAQNTIYRQNLSKEINVLNVFGDCTIILKLDTCNWIAYQGTENDLSQNFFTVAGNIVQTTAAANGKTLSVGTSASRTNNSAPLVIDIKDNARVIFMGDTLRKGRHTHSFYSGTVENKKKGTSTEWDNTISDKSPTANQPSPKAKQPTAHLQATTHGSLTTPSIWTTTLRQALVLNGAVTCIVLPLR